MERHLEIVGAKFIIIATQIQIQTDYKKVNTFLTCITIGLLHKSAVNFEGFLAESKSDPPRTLRLVKGPESRNKRKELHNHSIWRL